jgi:hypothetical protein
MIKRRSGGTGICVTYILCIMHVKQGTKRKRKTNKKYIKEKEIKREKRKTNKNNNNEHNQY